MKPYAQLPAQPSATERVLQTCKSPLLHKSTDVEVGTAEDAARLFRSSSHRGTKAQHAHRDTKATMCEALLLEGGWI